MKKIRIQTLCLVLSLVFSYSQSFVTIYDSYSSGTTESKDKVDPFIVFGPNNQIGICYTLFYDENAFWTTINYVYQDQQSTSGWGSEYIEPYNNDEYTYDYLEPQMYYIGSSRVLSFRYKTGFDYNNYSLSGNWATFIKQQNGNWNEEITSMYQTIRTYSEPSEEDDTIYFLGSIKDVSNEQNQLKYFKRNPQGGYNPAPNPGYDVASSDELYYGYNYAITVGQNSIPYFFYIEDGDLVFKKYDSNPIIIGSLSTNYVDPWNAKLNKTAPPTSTFNTSSGIGIVVYTDLNDMTGLWSLFYSKSFDNGISWTSPELVIDNTVDLAYPFIIPDNSNGNFLLCYFSFDGSDLDSPILLNAIEYLTNDNYFYNNPIDINIGALNNHGSHAYRGHPINSKLIQNNDSKTFYVSTIDFNHENETNFFLYELELPNQVQFTFRNMIEDENAGGNLKLTNNNTGVVEEFQSGSSRYLNIDNFYTIETLPRVYNNYDFQGEVADYKHNNWGNISDNFRFSLDFVSHVTGTGKDANYGKISNITFSTDYENLDLFFRDPWYFNPETQTQPNQFHPLSEQIDENGNVQVFLSQNPDFETGVPTYYIKAPQYIGKLDGIYEFSGWRATPESDADFENPNNRTSRVVFLQEGVTIEPEYENLISDGGGTIYINDKLVIPAGANIHFGSGFSMTVDYEGELLANGTETNPILLTSNNSSWSGITVWDDGKLNLNNTTIENTGTGILAQIFVAYGEELNQIELNNVHFINNTTGLKIEGGINDYSDGYNIILNGCEFENHGIGIEIINLGNLDAQISNISISNSEFLSNEKGIYAEHTVENLSINNCNFDGSNVAIEITDQAHDTQIIELSVSNSTFSSNERGILAGKNVRHLDIGHNTFSENDSSIVLTQVWANAEPEFTSATIHHNHFTDSDNPIRIKQFWPDEYEAISAETNIHHNTFYESKDAIWYVKMDGISKVWNNSFFQGSQWAIYARVQCTGIFEAFNNIIISFQDAITIGGYDFEYNYFSDIPYDDWPNNFGDGNIIGNDGDPIFIDPPYNFHLLPGSVCIDTGKTDFDGDGIDFDGPDDILGNADDDLDDQDPDGTRMDLGAFYLIGIPELEITGEVGQNPTLTWNAISFENGSAPIYEIYSYNEFDQTPIFFAETTSVTINDERFIIAYIEEDETGRNVGLKKLDKEPEQTSRIKQYWKLRVRDTEGNHSDFSQPDYAWVEVAQSIWKLATPIIPKDYELNAAFPNPFNPVVTVPFGLPVESDVTISIYNLMGQKLRSFESTYIQAGYHQVQWNSLTKTGRNVPSGLYIVRMNAASTNGKKSFNKSQKIVLLK